jgi:hypothetical protein
VKVHHDCHFYAGIINVMSIFEKVVWGEFRFKSNPSQVEVEEVKAEDGVGPP